MSKPKPTPPAQTPLRDKLWSERIGKFSSALIHWQKVGYSLNTARALASVLHGRDSDVRAWARNIMETQTNLKLEDMV